MDGQPNDHLGWIWSRHHLFEHRRQVLRGCANTHPNAYPNVHANANPDTNAMRGEMCTHTEAAPDSGAAPIT